jgi:hypothetical protein
MVSNLNEGNVTLTLMSLVLNWGNNAPHYHSYYGQNIQNKRSEKGEQNYLLILNSYIFFNKGQEVT